MEKLNSGNFDRLIEQLLHNLIDESNRNESSNIEKSEGKIVINFNQNNHELILLTLYLLKYSQSNNKINDNFKAPNQNEYKEKAFSNEELKDLIQAFDNLRRKNKDFLGKINQLLPESN